MNKKDLDYYKKLLIERKRDLLAHVSDQDDDIDELRREQAADPLDMASKTTSLEMMSVLEDTERREIEEIDYALEKIQFNNYGVCEDCEEDIAPARLEAIPTARLCVKCKQKQERNPQRYFEQTRIRRRALSEDDFTPSTDDDE